MLYRTHLSVLSCCRKCIARRQFHATASLLARRKVVHQFRLADIGEGITECEVIKWSVKQSTVVQSFDPLCEVQSDKASVEITSPFDGIVTELLVKEGEVAKVGEGLCLIEIEEDMDESVNDLEEAPATAIPDSSSPPGQKIEMSSISQCTQGIPHPLDPSQQVESASGRDILAAPSVRYFAKQNGVDLSAIGVGSGKAGRIEKKDVETFLSQKSIKQSPSVPPMFQTGDQEIELGRTRFAMWKSMTKSLEIPHFGYSTALDLTKLSNLLPTFNNYIPSRYLQSNTDVLPQAVSPHSVFSDTHSPSQADPMMQFTRLTFLPLLLKTLSRAMLEWPLFRSSVSSIPDPASKRKPTLIIRPHVDISIALSTPTGLYTPTLTSIDTLSTYEIMGRLQRLQKLGRQVPCALGPSDMPKRGGTVTISNVGAIGKGEFASPVLVPGGGLAIVAIGRARWVDAVPDDGVGASKRKLQVGISWSADHRVVEGAELAAFVETWRSWVENPERLVADAV